MYTHTCTSFLLQLFWLLYNHTFNIDEHWSVLAVLTFSIQRKQWLCQTKIAASPNGMKTAVSAWYTRYQQMLMVEGQTGDPFSGTTEQLPLAITQARIREKRKAG